MVKRRTVVRLCTREGDIGGEIWDRKMERYRSRERLSERQREKKSNEEERERELDGS